MLWFKPAGLQGYPYPKGWPLGIGVDFVGSKFVPTDPNQSPLLTQLGIPPALTPTSANALLGLSDGGLADALNNQLSISPLNTVTVLGPPPGGIGAQGLSVTLWVNGRFTGSFTHPHNGQTTGYQGVLLQKSKTGSGYFFGPPPTGTTWWWQSGAVTISPQ